MKQIAVLVYVSLLALSGCEKCLPEPFLSTSQAVSITSDSAVFEGQIESSECSPLVTSQGFVYSELNSFPTLSDRRIQVNSNNLSELVSNLKPATTYYYRTYLTNNNGEFFGNVISFETPIGPAVLSNIRIRKTRAKYVDVNIRRADLRGGTSIASGIEVSLNEQFSSIYRKIPLNLNNEVSERIANLTPNTTFYIRSYLQNESGISYSPTSTFTTMSGQVEFTNKEFFEIGKSSAKFRLTLSDDGGVDIAEWGFVYSNGNDFFYGKRVRDNISLGQERTGEFTARTDDKTVPINVKPYYVEEGSSGINYVGEMTSFFAPNSQNINLDIETIAIGERTGQYRTISINGVVVDYIERPMRTLENLYIISGGAKTEYVQNFGVFWKRSGTEWDDEDVGIRHFLYWEGFQEYTNTNSENINCNVTLKYLPPFTVGFDWQFRAFILDYDGDFHYSDEVIINVPE